MNYKGNNNEDNSLNNKIINAFNALVVNMDPNTLLNKDDQAIIYYILYGKIELNNITTIALKLANKVYSYAVITIDIITDTFFTNTDLFIYNTTLYYTFIRFINIIINIKASKYFTAKYSQFFAL